MTLDINNLGSIFETYIAYLTIQNPTKPHCDANIKTALIRYALPGWGVTPKKGQDPIELMRQIPLHQFKDALAIQEKVFESLGKEVSGAVRRNYRMHLKRMLEWCNKQRWWKQEYTETVAKYAPKIRKGRKPQAEVMLTANRGKAPYSLKDGQLNDKLIDELSEFHRFLISPSIRKRQDDPVVEVTAKSFIKKIKLILGWLHNIKKHPLNTLCLNLLDDVDLIYEFTDWARTEREIVPGTELSFVQAVLALAKFHHHKKSNTKLYRDIEVIEELRELMNSISKRADKTPKTSDESKKWLEWREFLAAVEQLKQECALRTDCGKLRSDRAIGASYQKYLIAAFLAYMPPDRQRTLRELELGRTLVKENEKWFIKLGIKDYKTGEIYGEHISSVPDILYPELEVWLNKWRLVFKPNHNLVFTKLKGEPIDDDNFYRMFQTAMYRLTGKRTNPHLVRAMAITHFQRNGATDAEMEALALAMKHSREMQRSVYDHRTQQEKIAPAMDMMLRQKPSTLPPPPKLDPVKLDAINK